MKILFVTKRRPQQRDLIERPYGRFHYLPVEMAALGHQVKVLLCSHARLPSLRTVARGVEWSSHDFLSLGPAAMLRILRKETLAFAPDWVVGVSDTYCGWLAQGLAKHSGAHLAIDAYDNYEAYMPWNFPLHALWRRAVRSADLVTAAGPQLATRLQNHRQGCRPVEILPMVADPEFKPLDRQACRRRLGLPADARLIGYLGSWTGNRGTTMLLDAFRRVSALRPGSHLVLSGRPPARAMAEPGVIATGYVADDVLPVLVNALDIACVVTADTSFGRYSYPAKLCEATASGVPVVATDTDAVRWMLKGNSLHLAKPCDAESFAERILDLLDRPSAEYGDRATWTMQAKTLLQLLANPFGSKDNP